ncbi:MAG TPA: IS110 family transposase [Bdellovibrionota bacterium]|nr:IS110 family transposase [Bdellovibrionota bacterium]
MQAKYSIGIDLHKSVIQVCVLDERGEVIEEFRESIETREEGRIVVERLTTWREGGRLVVEAVGVNRWFVNACHETGLGIVVADPVKLNLQMLGKKTDRRDARELARRLYLGDIDAYGTTYYPTEEEYGVRKILRVRHHLVKVRKQITSQLRAFLNAYKLPARVVLYGTRSMEQLKRLLFPTEELNVCFSSLLSSLESIQQTIEHLSEQIRKRAAEEKLRNVRTALPGVGPQTAATLVYELGDVNRFANAKAVAAYAGLVPRVSQSADTKHHGRLTKRGNRELRWILGEWAVRLLKTNRLAQAWAKPLLRRMHKNKVRMALARRLLIGVYILLKRGEVFSLERCLAV